MSIRIFFIFLIESNIIKLSLTHMGNQHSQNWIGLVQLKDPYNPETLPQLPTNTDIRQMFKKQHWYLDKGKFSSNKLQGVFPYIKEAKITILNLVANNSHDLPATLSHISFPTLLRLKLCGNNIASIDSLVFLRANQLIELALSWNNIGSTRPLRKCCFPKLKYLNLEQNSINNMAEDLSICQFPQLRQVCVQSGAKSLVLCDSLQTWCVKWQSRLLYEVVSSSSRRINRPKASKMMKEKYLNLKIFKNGQRKQVTI